MSINIAVLTGRLTKDAELKYTQNNTPIANFTIAVDRKVKSGGERQADFINIVAWRQTAEFVSKYFKKGSAMGIEGFIQTRKYQDKDGNNRIAFEVVANNVHFVDSKGSDGNNGLLSVTLKNDPLLKFKAKIDDFAELEDTDSDLPF